MKILQKMMTPLLMAVIATVCLNFTSVAQNMVTNGDFEEWDDGLPVGWFGDRSNIPAANVVEYTESVHGGSSACQLINATGDNRRLTTKAISVVSGQTYIIKFWVRGHGDCRSGLWDGQGTEGINYIYDPQVINVNSDTWTQQTFSVTAPATVDNAEFIILVRNTNADKDHLQFDDVEVTSSGTIPLKANFKADKTTAGIGAVINFTDLSTGGPTVWEWTVSGPETMTSTEQHPSFTFTKAGNYDVTLIVTNEEESDIESKADYISIGDFLLYQDFNSGTFGDWEAISVIGDQKWIISNNGGPDGSPCAQMNGFSGSNHANEDWLVSPEISAPAFILNFDNAKNFNGDSLKVLISTNYNGDVTTATWNECNYNASTGSYNWVNSGDIKYTPQGGKAHIAFKYVSTTSTGALWRVDNIKVRDAGTQSIGETAKTEVKVFPNPTRGELKIENGELKIENVEVYDVMGRKMIFNFQLSTFNSIDVSHLGSGTYFLKITMENGAMTTQKVVVR
ncbi:MAG: T9SS type A sorting domain-containing protein [Bacteroidales bacterium]|nr:T9SS type A sorting domain-containing protein [Bacteroidales bacterium]